MSGKTDGETDGRATGLKFSAWNLLLLIPLLILVTPMFNSDEPRLLGLPFFYWCQLAFVIVGVLCVGIVYVKTKDAPAATGKRDELTVDDLDEGEER